MKQPHACLHVPPWAPLGGRHRVDGVLIRARAPTLWSFRAQVGELICPENPLLPPEKLVVVMCCSVEGKSADAIRQDNRKSTADLWYSNFDMISGPFVGVIYT